MNTPPATPTHTHTGGAIECGSCCCFALPCRTVHTHPTWGTCKWRMPKLIAAHEAHTTSADRQKLNAIECWLGIHFKRVPRVPRAPLHSMLIGYAHTEPPLEEKVQQNAQRNTWAASRDEAWIANAPVRFWALFAHFSISYWNKTRLTFQFPFPYFIWIEFENAAIRFWALLAHFSKIWNWNKKQSLLFHFPFEFENDLQSRRWKPCRSN